MILCRNVTDSILREYVRLALNVAEVMLVSAFDFIKSTLLSRNYLLHTSSMAMAGDRDNRKLRAPSFCKAKGMY